MDNKSIKRTLLTGAGIAALSVVVSTMSIAQQPKTVTLSIDNHELSIETNSKTVSDVLEDIGYTLEDTARINQALDAEVEADMLIDIDTQKDIQLNLAGNQVDVRTYAETVEELLNEEKIELSKDDIVSPRLENKLENGDKVTVDFYDVEEYSKTEDVAFKTIKTKSFDLAYGKEEVKTAGKDGKKQLNYKKIVKNGETLSDDLVNEEIIEEAINEEVLVGTKEVVEKAVKFKTITRNNSNIYVGQTKTVQKGQKGLIRQTFENDGESRKLVEEKTVRKVRNKIVEKGTKKRPIIPQTSTKKPAVAKTSSNKSSSSARLYSLRDLQFQGVIRWGGYKYTYYSQQVLPGGGLRIPGRHVNAGGFVADKDGYIVLANSRPKGTILPTPFGYMGKVYDRGTYGNHLDVYTR